jgi:hypothetical protein
VLAATNINDSCLYNGYMSEVEIVVEKKKTLGVTEETYRELVKAGGYGETMDHIIRKCVEAYKREQARTSKK